ncbi:type IV pilin protein [Pseudomonas sp. Pseu.R1]|uniref:type IV pilin protein n=1 Tax=Pseudomonas sp. Pseu.R1 TaxID=3379818 RepID=UPI003B94B0A5
MLTRSPQQRGFTLIELMITVAIVAILAAVAYPSYTSYVLRGNRSEGTAMLSDAVARMERYYAQNNSYPTSTTTTLSALGITNANSASGRYTLQSSVATATTYTLQVVAQGTQTKDTGCTTLSISQDGTRSPDPTTTSCWK